MLNRVCRGAREESFTLAESGSGSKQRRQILSISQEGKQLLLSPGEMVCLPVFSERNEPGGEDELP